MGHGLFIGMSESGKTTLAMQIAATLRQRWTIAVLDGRRTPAWQKLAHFWARTPAELKHYLFVTARAEKKRCMVFIDEAGSYCGVHQKENHDFATQGRHDGHSVFFISQRATQIAPIIREQCKWLYLFHSSETNARLLKEDFNKNEILDAPNLDQGEYLYIQKFEKVTRHRVW